MSTEDNKAIIRRLIEEVWNQKDLTVADELIASTHVDHTFGGPPELPPALDGFKQWATGIHTAVSDIHYTAEDMIAEGDIVVTRWTGRGTHTGDLPGIPATGDSVAVAGVSIDRFENGQIVESWGHIDQLSET